MPRSFTLLRVSALFASIAVTCSLGAQRLEGKQLPGKFIVLGNVTARPTVSLEGTWRTIVDPYNTGFEAHWELDEKAATPQALVEYNFDESKTLNVPGDWNTQRPELLYYEGTVWYRRLFNWKPTGDKREFLHFAAVNNTADVFLNGKSVGRHEGGNTPFDLEVTGLLLAGSNSLVVAVNNQRHKESIPSLNTDWWNYGGVIRTVSLVELPPVFIENYKLQLVPGSDSELSGWVQLNGASAGSVVTLEIPEANLITKVKTDAEGRAFIHLKASLVLWSPERPKLYKVHLSTGEDVLDDEVGFRSIVVRGSQLLLNGKPIFLRGICMQEDAPFRGGKAFSLEDEQTLFGWAKDLHANFIRLAHYPHNENVTHLADKLGILLWEEVPVYWVNDWKNPATLSNAEEQLATLIARDQNRASSIFWSVANETVPGPERNAFLHDLITYGRSLDSTRLFTAATADPKKTAPHELTIVDPLTADLDVVGLNEYIGWYGKEGVEEINQTKLINPSGKPLIISEFGADAQAGLHGSVDHRWTEEFQADIFRRQLSMVDRTDTVVGLSPWVLMDFLSPRRNLPGIQDLRNRKGIVSDRGQKKLAFDVLANYYVEKISPSAH